MQSLFSILIQLILTTLLLAPFYGRQKKKWQSEAEQLVQNHTTGKQAGISHDLRKLPARQA